MTQEELQQQHRTLKSFWENCSPDEASKVDLLECDNMHSWSALHWASAFSTPEVCRRLLERGANIEARDVLNGTPLLAAAGSLNLGTMEALLEAGANPNVCDKDGQSASCRLTYNDDLSRIREAATVLYLHGYNPELIDTLYPEKRKYQIAHRKRLASLSLAIISLS